MDLGGVFAKLDRADEHLSELDRVLGSVFDTDMPRYRKELVSGGTKLVYRAEGLPPIDPRWSLIIGDVLTNLRASLDYLAWQLVLLGGREPTTKTKFPIMQKPNFVYGAAELPELLPGPIPTEIRSALDECQPYKRQPGDERQHQLWGLNHLVNIDKHKLLLVAEVAADIGNMWFGLDYKTPPPTPWISDAALTDQDVIASFDFGYSPAPAQFDPHLAITVRLDEGPLDNRISVSPLRAFLQSILDYILWILRAHFLPLFPIDTPGFPSDPSTFSGM